MSNSQVGLNYCIRIIEKSQLNAVDKLKDALNVVGVVGASVACGVLIWKCLRTSKSNQIVWETEQLEKEEDELRNNVSVNGNDSISFINFSKFTRMEPEGESEDEEGRNEAPEPILDSYSSFNSLIDERMMDIVISAKETRALIRRMSFTDSEEDEENLYDEAHYDSDTHNHDCMHYVSDFRRGAHLVQRSHNGVNCNYLHPELEWDNIL